jgi:hypothetical protein
MLGKAKDRLDFLVGKVVYGYDVPGLVRLIWLHRRDPLCQSQNQDGAVSIRARGRFGTDRL